MSRARQPPRPASTELTPFRGLLQPTVAVGLHRAGDAAALRRGPADAGHGTQAILQPGEHRTGRGVGTGGGLTGLRLGRSRRGLYRSRVRRHGRGALRRITAVLQAVRPQWSFWTHTRLGRDDIDRFPGGLGPGFAAGAGPTLFLLSSGGGSLYPDGHRDHDGWLTRWTVTDSTTPQLISWYRAPGVVAGTSRWPCTICRFVPPPFATAPA